MNPTSELPSASDVKVFLMFHRLHPEVFPDIMEYVIPIAQAYCDGRLGEMSYCDGCYRLGKAQEVDMSRREKMKPSETFKTLLCNPDGKVSIGGSEEDEKLLQEAIQEVAALEALMPKEEYTKFHDLDDIYPEDNNPKPQEAVVYQCPRCATSMDIDPSAKPSPQPQEVSVEDLEKFLWEWHNIFAPNRLDWMKQNLKELATAIHKKVYGEDK